ncbi:MAG TPA: helix-turn-helix transcriptional regulator [Steroidobacteraceae bacterium]
MTDAQRMTETQRMIETLKRCLRARGMSYARLGQALGLSESSVKRLFSQKSFTMARLERVCRTIDMSIADLARMTAEQSKPNSNSNDQAFTLTLAQERILAKNSLLLACFYLLLNGRSVQEMSDRLSLSERATTNLLSQLSAAGLLDVEKGNKIRMHARPPIAWRPDGPVRKLYERQVREEFLRSEFSGSNEALSFHSAELSPASIRILMRKLEKLGADFADLAALDVALPSKEKVSIAMLLACRPWVFSMFSAYRPRAASVRER